jgi:hypothetical protein
MGKKNKTINPMMYKYQNPKKWAELKERYNVRGAQGGKPDNYGPGSERRDEQDVYNDILAASRNDYDTRRSIEAAAMSGNKKAKKLNEGGFNTLHDVAKAQNVLAKLKKKHVGGGGMGGAKNIMGLTDALVSRDRERLVDELKSGSNIGSGSGPELEPAAPQASDYLTDSYGFQDVTKSDTPTQAAQDFRKGYTADVVAGLGLEEQTGLNLSNAMRYIS